MLIVLLEDYEREVFATFSAQEVGDDPPVVERDTFGNSSAQQNSDNDSDNDDVVCEIFRKYFF